MDRMKTTLYSADSRGFADHGWLKARHSFSFAGYFNRDRMHFGLLRVLNDDIVDPGQGFGTHPHDNMEIVTIPLIGALEHKDSTGNIGVIHPNEVQIMSAGSGLYHSEYNHSKEEICNLLQIWVFPKERDIKPRYDQRIFSPEERENQFCTLVSPEEKDNALWINQDAYFSRAKIDGGKSLLYTIKKKGNIAYLFVIEGEVILADNKLNRRDALGIEETDNFEITAETTSEVLVIEIPVE